MPVTKKKGAIFAIYADSPARAHSHGSTSANLPAASTDQRPSKSLPSNTSASAPVSQRATRKALTSLQPGTTKTKGFPLSAATEKDVGSCISAAEKPLTAWQKPSNGELEPVKPSVTSGKTKSKATAPPTKRQLEIFSSPAASSAALAQPAARPPSAGGASPTKRTRQTPRDKENHPPTSATTTTTKTTLSDAGVGIEGSPASRTRSKTSSVGSSIHFAMLAFSASPRARSSLKRTPGQTQAETPKHKHNRSHRQSGQGVTGALLGDGRETLTLSKGYPVASVMQKEYDSQPTASVDFDGEAESIASPRLRSHLALSGKRLELGDGEASGLTPRRISGAKAGAGKPGRGKGRTVRADGPLVDVSEAYGATGDEPFGFREQ